MIDAKIGVLMADDITFSGATILGGLPLMCACYLPKTEGMQTGGAQMNGLCKIRIRERLQLSIPQLEC